MVISYHKERCWEIFCRGWQPEFPEFENDTMGRTFAQNKAHAQGGRSLVIR